MTPSIRFDGIARAELEKTIDGFRKLIQTIGESKADECRTSIPGSVLSWRSGILRKGYVVIQENGPLSIVRIIETRTTTTTQLEMEWPTGRVPKDHDGIRDLVRRMMSMAMLVSMQASDPRSNPDAIVHRQAEQALLSEALMLNPMTQEEDDGVLCVAAATPWTPATVRLVDQQNPLDLQVEMMVVKRTRHADGERISIMPHILSVELGQTRSIVPFRRREPESLVASPELQLQSIGTCGSPRRRSTDPK